jgi:hypothetical protein
MVKRGGRETSGKQRKEIEEGKGKHKEGQERKQGEGDQDMRERIGVLEKVVESGKLFSLQGKEEERQEGEGEECRWYPMATSEFKKAQIQIDETLKSIRTLSISMSEINQRAMNQDLVQMIIDLAQKTAQLRSLVDIDTLQETFKERRGTGEIQEDSVKERRGTGESQEDSGSGAGLGLGASEVQGQAGLG